MSRRLPTEVEVADALLAQTVARGHYLKTPADEQCPSGVWLLVPLEKHHVRILDLAGEDRADLEYDEREPDLDDEPSLGSLDRCEDQEGWSAGISRRWQADEEECGIDHRTFKHPRLAQFRRF